MKDLEQLARQLQEAEISLQEFIDESGKIWYDRFEKELSKEIPTIKGSTITVPYYDHIFKVAKKAAGCV